MPANDDALMIVDGRTSTTLTDVSKFKAGICYL